LSRVLVGCAGWSLPRDVQAALPGEGSHLARYAARFPVVEINSSFHRPHRPSTYARWAAETPDSFRFAAKLPKTITHQLCLAAADEPLDAFLAESAGLGEKLAALLVQLPPSFAFDAVVAAPFFAGVAARTQASIVCKPRHPSWFEDEADALLAELRVARVAADPARVPAAADPGGWRGMTYHRLHGSPRMYYSSYPPESISTLAGRLRDDHAAEAWCIFDNTASGAAMANALELAEALAR
jgi:uncharacterized protein YecE (DUF72 family)